MINLPPIIERIAALLAEDTDASVTYAALEARLALEKVCYDRLRQCHDYISHAQLKRWQPRQIVNTLLQEVDQHATQTRTLHISRNPARPDRKPEEEEYVEIGTEVGFDPRVIEKLWNALAKLALHVHLPEHKVRPYTPLWRQEPDTRQSGRVQSRVRTALKDNDDLLRYRRGGIIRL